MLSDRMGVNALARFDRDVLSHLHADTVILMMGINDIRIQNGQPERDLPLDSPSGLPPSLIGTHVAATSLQSRAYLIRWPQEKTQ